MSDSFPRRYHTPDSRHVMQTFAAATDAAAEEGISVRLRLEKFAAVMSTVQIGEQLPPPLQDYLKSLLEDFTARGDVIGEGAIATTMGLLSDEEAEDWFKQILEVHMHLMVSYFDGSDVHSAL